MDYPGISSATMRPRPSAGRIDKFWRATHAGWRVLGPETRLLKLAYLSPLANKRNANFLY